MARSYSDDLRQRVLSTIEGGVSARQAAARFSIGVATAIVWHRRYRETGETTARRQGKPRGSKLDAHEGFLLEMIANKPDSSLAEMVAALSESCGISACQATVWRFLRIRGFTVKKNGARRRAGTP